MNQEDTQSQHENKNAEEVVKEPNVELDELKSSLKALSNRCEDGALRIN